MTTDLASTCSRHDTHQEECLECVQLLIEKKCKQATRLEKLLAQFPCLKEIVQQKIEIRNETASSAHVYTGHTPAQYKLMENGVPKVELSVDFWDHRTEFSFPENGINSEREVKTIIWCLLQVIVKALGLNKDVSTRLGVPIMDTAPDVTLTTSCCNKHIIGTAKVKKPPKTLDEKNKIFGSNTSAAGQAFEELLLCHIQNETFSVGLISTLGSFQLISNIDVSKREESLKPSDAVEYFNRLRANKGSTEASDKQKVLVDESMQMPPMNENKMAKVETTTSKNGRVSLAIEEADVDREYFASEVLEFGDEVQNRKVFVLLAAYVLLCVAAQSEGPGKPLDLTKPNAKCLTRQVTTKSFAFKEIKLPSGIQFQTQPSSADSTFYAARQLGYGRSGTCCFACTSNSAPCVIKFYRQHNEQVFDGAKEEAIMWQTLYGDFGIDFVKAFNSTRIFLVLPYLGIPCNLSERQRFVQGEKEEESMLYKALEHLISKGYVHDEVKWHHVGLWKVKVSGSTKVAGARAFNSSVVGQKRSEKDESTTAAVAEVAVFCDLAHAKRCDDPEKQKRWLNTTFNEMKQRIGDGPDQSCRIS